MGEPLLIALIVFLSLGAGMFLYHIFHVRKFLYFKPKQEKADPQDIARDSRVRLRDWLNQGVALNIFDETKLDAYSQRSLYEWLAGAPFPIFRDGEMLGTGERCRLTIWFAGTLAWLIPIGTICAWRVIREITKQAPTLPLSRPVMVAVLAGTMGSCIAAFRSCLERRANGFEDKDGNIAPGFERKERFSDGMAFFFMGRPLLGAAVGLLVYVGLMAGIFTEVVRDELLKDSWKFVFYLTVAGLFAKTILDLLLELVKKVFRVE